MLKVKTSNSEAVPVSAGALDGVTIMRYAHVYRDRSSGGVEQYLRHLDHGLLQRHRLTVLQMHLVRDDKNDEIELENVGAGRILWVPVPVRQIDLTLANLPNRAGYVFGRAHRLSRAQGEGQNLALLRAMSSLLRHNGGHLRHNSIILSDCFFRLLGTRKVNLLSLHWLSYDTSALIDQASRAGIPFVYINHFDNARLLLSQTRMEIDRAAAVGIVSDQNIPEDLRDRCVNLSDAVDTEFFRPERARSVDCPSCPIILLPARIQKGKGHLDLIKAAQILVDKRVDFALCFVGATDSETLHYELRGLVAANGMEGRVHFLGEKSAEEIRNWYAMSSVVVLPSYTEGLPRIVLEAQAMRKPVVAYDSGGTCKAMLANETGFLVRAGDVIALADKIEFLLQNEAERLRIGQLGREFVSSRFGSSTLIQQHEAFYLSAMSGVPAKSENSREVLAYVRKMHATSGIPNEPRTASLQKRPLVSILIPAFNAQKWIADTVRSAIGQTWEPKEIIVVDDGSTDLTLAIARQFESDSVQVVTQKNQGAAAARNRAYSLSKGDFIQWLDADDLLAPDKIAKQMATAAQHTGKRLLFSSAWGVFMYRYYRARFVPTTLWCDLPPVEWLLRKMGQNLYMQSASWLVSRELTEVAGPWDTRMLSDDDGEYFCRVLLASDGVRFIPEAKIYYRGPGLAFRSLSYIGQSSRKVDAHWLSMQLHIGYLRSLEESDRVRAACLNYLQTSLIYFYPEKDDIIKQADQLAAELGGKLGAPNLSWKYSWMKATFGWRRAKQGQQLFLSIRWWLHKVWDRSLLWIECS